MNDSKIRTLVEIAIGAVLIAICSWIAIPFTIPFTLQTFGIFLILVLFGGKKGLASIGLYILLGIVGVPVFSGFQGGIGHVLGLTGGYIVGFLFTGISYLLLEKFAAKGIWQRCVTLSIGLILCYLVGTIWFMVVSQTRDTETGFLVVLSTCVFPYIIPDAVKMALAIFLGKVLKPVLNRIK